MPHLVSKSQRGLIYRLLYDELYELKNIPMRNNLVEKKLKVKVYIPNTAFVPFPLQCASINVDETSHKCSSILQKEPLWKSCIIDLCPAPDAIHAMRSKY